MPIDRDPMPIDRDDIQLEIDDFPQDPGLEPKKRARSGTGMKLATDSSDLSRSVDAAIDERPFAVSPIRSPSMAQSRSPSIESRISRSRVSRQMSQMFQKLSPRKEIPISRTHPEFELTCDMMLGIRYTVGRSSMNVDDKPVSAKDFKSTFSYLFPCEGSSSTPAHPLPSFKFKDYQPAVYRSLRRRFGIDTADYLLCLCGDQHYLEFIANSKSGQFFFYSHNRQFMIKTITNSEAKFLQKILPYYYKYVMEHPNTLLMSFLGMHRVKPHKMKKMHFVIMGSVFYTDKFIHEVYDIKGSTVGRKATDAERCQDTPVLKDLDFIENAQFINIGAENGKLFLQQLQDDAKFLKKLKIMDYSLLLGIHKIEAEATRSMRSNDDGESRHRRKQSNYGLKTWHQVVASPQVLFDDLPEETAKNEQLSSLRNFQINPSSSNTQSIFRKDHGGICSVDASGMRHQNRIFFMGIIDILQRYNTRKQLEHHWKAIQYDKNTISAVNPTVYCNRFLEFLKRATII